jgi:hypothetical protein
MNAEPKNLDPLALMERNLGDISAIRENIQFGK